MTDMSADEDKPIFNKPSQAEGDGSDRGVPDDFLDNDFDDDDDDDDLDDDDDDFDDDDLDDDLDDL